MPWRPIVAKWWDGSRWHLAWRWALVQATSCHFSSHFCCGQMAGWIKMPLCMAVGLGPDHIVLDGDPSPPPPERAQQRPSFRPMSIVATVAHFSCCWACDTVLSVVFIAVSTICISFLGRIAVLCTWMQPVVTDWVAWSVCRTSEPCKNGCTDRDAVWVVGWDGP